MASYIQGVSDSPESLHTPQYTPDFGFLSANMQKKEQQYQQGQQQVASDYSAILNAPITNGENIEQKKQYLSTIQEGLKKVATTDLSLPKNVTQAENLYAPFWKDNDMLYDISTTRDATNKLQQAHSDQQSKDETIRQSYNPWSVARQNYVLEDLKMAKRGDGSIANVQRAEYLPIDDYQAYVNAQDKQAGFKGISTQTPNGPAMITETNGVKAIPQLRTRYDSMLGSKFQAQFSQQGWVMHRQELDQLSRNYPDIPRDALNHQLATDKYHQMYDMYNKSIDRYGSDLHSTYQMPIQAMYELKRKQGGLTLQQQQDLDKLEAGQEQFNGRLDQLSTERDQFAKANPGEKIKAIADNPEGYYGTMVRNETINKLADVQATNYKYSIDLNKIWDAVSTHREAEANIRLRGKELSNTAQNQLWEHGDRQDKITADYATNGINRFTGEGITNPTTGISSGVELTGQTQTDQQSINFANVLNQQKSNYLNVAASALFGRNGTANRLEDIDGISSYDLLQYRTLMGRLYSGENYDNKGFTQKPEEKQAFQNVRNSLSKYLGHDIPNTYDGMAKAQNEYITNELKRRSGDLKLPMRVDDPYAQAFSSMKIGNDAMQGYAGKVTEERTAIGHMTLADANSHHMLLNDSHTGVAGVADVANYSPTLDVVDIKTGNRKTISPSEYATAYLNKNLNMSNDNTIQIGNNTYHIDAVNGIKNEKLGDYTDYPGYDYGNKEYPATIEKTKVEQRFGTYEQRDNLNKSLQEKVANVMPSVRDHTGKTGMTISYGFGNAKSTGNGEKMIKESLNPANYTNIRFAGDKDDMTDADKSQLDALTGSYEEIRKNMGQPDYNTVSSTGQPVIRYTTNNWKDKDGSKVSKTIEVPLSPHPTGELLSSVPQSSGLYVYGKLMKGDILKNDDNDEHMGFRYQVVPDNADKPTSATVRSEHIEVDIHGKEHWVKDTDLSIDLVGPKAYNPDMIMGAVNQREVKTISALTSQRAHYNSLNIIR